MKECEFKKECEKLNPKGIRQFIGEHCGWETSDELDGCLYRKFAILVRNQTIEDVSHILINRGLPAINKECQALKTKESP